MPTPNVLFIAIDDLFDFTAFRDSFGVTIQTPNLDRLIGESTQFTNAFATTPVCNPSRTSSLTGKSPFETGVQDNQVAWYDVNDPAETLPGVMKDAGYHTAQAGKIFHGYKPQPEAVNERIFSEAVPDIRDTFDRSDALPTGGGWNAQGYVGQDDQFYDHKVASWGVDFLEGYGGDDPFMLMLGFKHPHNTFEMPQQYYDLYDVEDIKVPEAWVNGDLSDAPAFAAQFISKASFLPEKDFAEWQATVEAYIAAISHMDAQVGRVLDALEAQGLADDTVVVVHSDHGFQLGDKDHFGKFTLWEESAKAPLIIKVPGQEASVIATPVSLIDIMPTVLDATGVEGADWTIGESLLPLINSGEDPDRGPVFTQVYGSMSLRAGEMRFIRYADGSEELYDTSVDPGQTVNLAADPARAAELEALRGTLWDEAARYGVLTNDVDATLTGTAGDDVLMAQPETQTLEGGNGDDTYFLFDNTADIIETADGGHDIAYLAGYGPITLPDHVEDAFYGVLRAPGQVRLNGNELDNNITITGASMQIFAGAGDDTIRAEAYSVNRLWGEDGDDEITGGVWRDFLNGGAGNDRLDGGRGNDDFTGGAGADTLIGDQGFDTAVYRGSEVGVHVSLRTGFGYGGHAQGDRLSGIEQVYGSSHGDVLMGDDNANVFISESGNDYLNAQGGDDTLIGGAGADIMGGGAGFDVVSYQWSNTGISANLSLGRGWLGEAEGDTFWGVEGLTGSNRDDVLIGDWQGNMLTGRNGADYLHGGAGDDTLDGGRGADGLVGGRGVDTASYVASGEGVAVNLSTGEATGGDAEGDWFWSVEHIEGTRFADTLTGHWQTGGISGGQGSDDLVFGFGNTAATGGSGEDRFIADSAYLRSGAQHSITDFEQGHDALLLRGEASVQAMESVAGNTQITLQSEMDGETFLSLLTVEGVELSETDVVHEDDLDGTGAEGG